MRLSTTWHFLCALSFRVASTLDNTAFVPSSSDSDNSCTDDFDNTALMQTRLALTRDRDLESNHKHHHAKIERAEHIRDAGIMETTVRSMSTTIDDLEHKIHDDPSGSWDEQSATLSSFRATIADQLQVFLDSEHEQDQTEFNNRKQQHSGCGGGQRWEPGGDVANAAAELARWRAKHQACRSSERAWLTYKTAGISSSSCASDSDISTKHQVLAAHVTLATLVGAAQSRADAYHLTDPVLTRDCPLDQTQFEDHFCTWRSAHYYACAASQDCAAQTGLSGLGDELLIRSVNRRNLWRTLEMLLCRVGLLLGSMDGDSSTEVSDFNTTDDCSNILLDQTKFVLDLTIPDIPVCNDHIAVGSTTSILVAPSMVDSVMCQQFRAANYGLDYGWDQGQHVIPSECEATCPAISYSTWVVPEACINEPDDCRFYNHHRDACGSYDTPTFVAGDVCCACGGGASASGTEGLNNPHSLTPPPSRPWRLAFNIDTRDGHVVNYANAEFWESDGLGGATSDAAAALTQDYKDPTVFGTGIVKEVLIVVHDEGEMLGWRRWRATQSHSSLKDYFTSTANSCAGGGSGSVGGSVQLAAESIDAEVGSLDAHEPMVVNSVSSGLQGTTSQLWINAGGGDYNRLSTAQNPPSNYGWGLGTAYDTNSMCGTTMRPQADAQMHVDHNHWGSSGGIGGLIGTDHICNTDGVASCPEGRCGGCPWTVPSGFDYDYAVFVEFMD